jgi:hypothetical protein
VNERKDSPKLKESDPHEGDELGPYTPERLIRMDRRFTTAIERAFRTGTENPQAAARTTTRLR